MNKLQENYKRFFKEDVSIKEFTGNKREGEIHNFIDSYEVANSDRIDYYMFCAIAGALNLDEKTVRGKIEHYVNIGDYNNLTELLNQLLDLETNQLETLMFQIFKLN